MTRRTAQPSSVTAHRSDPTRLKGAWIDVAVAAVLTLAFAVPLLGLNGHLDLSVPFDYGADALSGSVNIRSVLDHGWLTHNPDIGAPGGRYGNDFPGADNLHLMVVAVMGLFTKNWAVVLNLYFLATFPLAAMTATWFFRRVEVSRTWAVTLGVLYAYAPYHYVRGEQHLYLSAYYVVPPAVWLIVRTLRGEALWGSSPLLLRRATCVGQSLATFVSLVALGTASSYYSVFTLLLLTAAGLLGLLRTRRWRRAVGVLSAQALLVSVMVANMLPNLLFERAHGQNLVALSRFPKQTEIYAFKITSLLLPAPYHRVHALAQLRATYDSNFPYPSERPTLGLVAAAGFVLLLAAALLTLLRGGGVPSATGLPTLGALAILIVLLGTTGGLGSLFALFVSDNIRGWNRLAIFLSLIALAAVGLVCRPGARRRWKVLSPVLAILVLAVGLFDQTPAEYPPHTKEISRQWRSDTTFVRSIESALPAGAMVFQLPYMFFPEAPPQLQMHDSEPFRLYLHSTSLRWSYGGIRGRPQADWPAQVARTPVPRMLGLLAAAGFDGVTVDRAGALADGRSLEGALKHSLKIKPTVSPDGRFSFWDLRAYGLTLRSRIGSEALSIVGSHVLLHPLGYVLHGESPTPTLFIDNPRTTTEEVGVKLTVALKAATAYVKVSWPDHSVDIVRVEPKAAVVFRFIRLPPGRTFVRMQWLDSKARPFRALGLDVQDEELSNFRP
jgi:hypothetical protein